MKSSPRIEALEDRIAPAAVFVNSTTATYTDNDGDHVTVKFTKPLLTAGNLPAMFQFGATYLETLDFATAVAPDGTSLTFSVVKSPFGDGVVNVGFIKANGVDFNAIKIPGDLGRLLSGDANLADGGVKSLAVNSLGLLGTDSGGNTLQSNVNGTLGSFTVKHDIKDASLTVSNGNLGSVSIGGSLIGGTAATSGYLLVTGDIGPVKIGGDIVGNDGSKSGSIEVFGKMGSLTIGGSLVGGKGMNSGWIAAGIGMGAVKVAGDIRGGDGTDGAQIITAGVMGSVTIGGSVLGGAGASGGFISGAMGIGAVTIAHDLHGAGVLTAEILATNGKIASVTIGGSMIAGAGATNAIITSLLKMGPVKIAHDVAGGSGSNSAAISSADALTSVTIGGSFVGGTGDNTGSISASNGIGAIKIGRDFIGGSISAAAATLDGSGTIICNGGRILSISIGGSIISGHDDSNAGALTRNAFIHAGNDLPTLTVGGSIIGNSTTNGESPVIISARGQATQTATADVAFGNITVGGRVEHANILAGFNNSLVGVNGDAQIGAVTVGGNWIASNIAAGVQNLGNDNAVGGVGANADNVNFGNVHDFSIGGGTPAIIAKIASITVGGYFYGTPAAVNNTDSFGLVAEQITAIKQGGLAVLLTAGPHNNFDPIGQTLGDVFYREA